VRIVTANIKNNPDMPDTAVRADMREVAPLGGIVLFQEIGEPEDHLAIDAAFAPRRWHHLHRDLAIPILIKRRHWKVLDVGFELMHHGKAGASPNRYIAWAVIRRRGLRARLRGLKPIVVMNTHFVSGAWNAKDKRHKDWRKVVWNLHWSKMRDRVLEFCRQGYTVIFGGDFNRIEVQKFHASQQWLHSHGIDKIGYVEGIGGSTIEDLDSHVRTDLYSDHHAHSVTVGLRPPATS
jgi:hypothetical protein